MEYSIAWTVVVAAGVGVLIGVYALTRPIESGWLRALICWLVAVWLLVPWKIQVVEDHYAPAYIVALFEGVFRADGNPRPPLILLALATIFVLIPFLVIGAFRWARSA